MSGSEEAATTDVDVKVEDETTDKNESEDIESVVSLTKDKRGLGLKIALSKAKENKPPVLFINGFARLSDGSLGEAEKESKFAMYDILTKVNDQEVGTDLKLVGSIIRDVEVGEPITFTVTRHITDEKERLKEIDDQKNAEAIEAQLLVIFRKAGDNADEVSLEDIESIDRAALDNLGLHLPTKPFKEMDAFKGFADKKLTWVSFEEAMLTGSALECRTTRAAHYAAVFAELDNNKDGSISLEEFTAHAKEEGSLFNKYFKNLASDIASSFEEMDADKNNSLSWEEFVKCAEKAFMSKLHPLASNELEASMEVAIPPLEEALQNKIEPTPTPEAVSEEDAEAEQKKLEEARAAIKEKREKEEKAEAEAYLKEKEEREKAEKEAKARQW